MEGFKGGGEVRRLNIVYLLSRNRRVEHPHLIRVHHLHRNGVRLRDVKRWLSELRGKEMPESFAWSYKRRYKTGYVWQDLMDDDLITPVSDNEYVLKGSELSNAPAFQCFDELSCGDGKKPKAVEEEEEEEGEGKKVTPEKSIADSLQIEPDVEDGVSPKPPPCLDQDSPRDQPRGSDASNEYSIRSTALFKLDLSREFEKEKRKEGKRVSPGMADHNIDHINDDNKNNYSKRASHVIRNIFTCGQVEINDSLRTIKGRNGGDGSLSYHHQGAKSNNSRKGRSKSEAKTRPGEKAVRAAYKPVAAPNCSQCGKAFKPEKLHSHMKSCKALRGRGKRMNSERMPLRTESQEEDFSTESAPSLLLTPLV